MVWNHWTLVAYALEVQRGTSRLLRTVNTVAERDAGSIWKPWRSTCKRPLLSCTWNASLVKLERKSLLLQTFFQRFCRDRLPYNKQMCPKMFGTRCTIKKTYGGDGISGYQLQKPICSSSLWQLRGRWKENKSAGAVVNNCDGIVFPPQGLHSQMYPAQLDCGAGYQLQKPICSSSLWQLRGRWKENKSAGAVIYIYIHVCMYYVYIYIYTHTCTYIHTRRGQDLYHISGGWTSRPIPAILVTRTGPVAIFSDVPWEKHQERHAVDVALRQLFDEDVQAVVDGS